MNRQKSLFDIYRNSRKDELHKMFNVEIDDAVKWLQRNFTTHKKELSYHSAAEAMGLDFGEIVFTKREIIKALKEELGAENPPPRLVEICMEAAQKESPLTNPEQMVRYYERMRILKSRKIADVAEFIVLQDISQATQDDRDEIKDFLMEVARKSRVGESITEDIVKLARYFDVDETIIKRHLKGKL